MFSWNPFKNRSYVPIEKIRCMVDCMNEVSAQFVEIKRVFGIKMWYIAKQEIVLDSYKIIPLGPIKREDVEYVRDASKFFLVPNHLHMLHQRVKHSYPECSIGGFIKILCVVVPKFIQCAYIENGMMVTYNELILDTLLPKIPKKHLPSCKRKLDEEKQCSISLDTISTGDEYRMCSNSVSSHYFLNQHWERWEDTSKNGNCPMCIAFPVVKTVYLNQ
jgi:hypothetical protein